MDIESFSQCLNYLQASAQSKGYFEKSLPIAGALIGTALGFFLNYSSGRIKENKAAQNKIMCINEDLAVINHSLDELAKEATRLITLLVQKQPLSGNRLPGSISSLCLDSYFIEVAHKYSKNQRYWIQLLLARVKEINIKLGSLHEDQDLYTRSITLMNMISLAVECARLCKMSLSNILTDHISIHSYLEELDIPSEDFEAYKYAESNAKAQNAVLGL